MATLIVQESSSRTKQPLTHKFNAGVITIGRGYENDVILDDGYICPSHARIEETDEGWQIVDQKSRNGVYIRNRKKKVEGADLLQSGDILELGSTRLKIVLPGDTVPESKKMQTAARGRVFERLLPFLSWTLSLVCLGLVALTYYFNIGEEKISEDLLRAAVSMGTRGMILLVWSVGWAFVGYELKNSANFPYHLFMIAGAVTLYDIANFTNGFMAYNSGYNLHACIKEMIPAITGVFVFAFSLKAASHIPKKIVYLTSVTFAVLVVGVIWADEVKDRARDADFPYREEALLGSWAQLPDSKSIDQILKESETVFTPINK